MLSGKVVIVTGAGGGLGAAYARDAARHGARVVVNDVNAHQAEEVAADIRTRGGTATANGDSVASADGARALVAACLAAYGRLDGLVNNAGVFHEGLPWEEDAARMARLVEVNVLGPLLCGVEAIRIMREQGGGSVVNVSSGAALGLARQGSYCASKGAMASLTFAWALDTEDCGIRVNAISPLAYTPLTESSAVARATVSRDRLPERVAPLVSYLLSDAAAGLTGQFVRFDGEQLALIAPPRVQEHALRRPAPAGDGQPAERARWTADDIKDAFAGPLRQRLEVFGLQRRSPRAARDADVTEVTAAAERTEATDGTDDGAGPR